MASLVSYPLQQRHLVSYRKVITQHKSGDVGTNEYDDSLISGLLPFRLYCVTKNLRRNLGMRLGDAMPNK